MKSPQARLTWLAQNVEPPFTIAPIGYFGASTGATHLFPEPGALEEVAQLARDWFERHLK